MTLMILSYVSFHNYVSKLINQNFQFLIISSDVVKHALELLNELYYIN